LSFPLPFIFQKEAFMVDELLITKANKKSSAIEAIDRSWREQIRTIKENQFSLPFKGAYSAFIENDLFLVEGYNGPLVIDRLSYAGINYLLKTPITCCPFKVYGVYAANALFKRFASRPEIGFHYMGLTDSGHNICTGDIEYSNPDSLLLLQHTAAQIVAAFRTINLNSLGTVFLPDSYRELREIFAISEDYSKRVGRLLEQGLMEKIF